MARLASYSIYNPTTLENIFNKFLETLIDTNRGFNFFVDWEKVKRNIDELKIEIGLLTSLIGSNDIYKDFKNLITKYPEVVKALPLIVALRDKNIKVIETIDSPQSVRSFLFDTSRLLNYDHIEDIYEFCNKTGIIDLLKELNSIKDYLTGVEVGMDTNARKNRSGIAMELAVLPLIETIVKADLDLDFLFQKQFKEIENLWGLSIPAHLKERKFDYVIKKGDVLINIEVNFYSGGGSKPQEIVDSYINRQDELHDGKWKFIWITDGYGWRTGKNQIYRAFEEIDFLLNLEFCRQGILNKIINTI